MIVIGALLLLVGIVFEGLYLTNSQANFYGTTISQNTYLVTGLVFILGGLLLSWAGLKTPKVQTVRS